MKLHDITISEIVEGYLEAMLWTEEDWLKEQGAECPDFLSLSKELVISAVKDCNDFMEKSGDLVIGIENSQIGHDFWLTRNRHGVGFWDRGLGDIGEQLTDICYDFGDECIYVGDDGLIYSL